MNHSYQLPRWRLYLGRKTWFSSLSSNSFWARVDLIIPDTIGNTSPNAQLKLTRNDHQEYRVPLDDQFKLEDLCKTVQQDHPELSNTTCINLYGMVLDNHILMKNAIRQRFHFSKSGSNHSYALLDWTPFLGKIMGFPNRFFFSENP